MARAGNFHEGELALQAEAGVADRMRRLGPQVIRDYLSEQHRTFFPPLPFIILGSVDALGYPSASLLAGSPGFVWSPTPTSLRVDALPAPGVMLDENLRPGAPVGLLGIQPHTKRRNRANGSVLSRDDTGVTLTVDQSFGNCPKYIQPRELIYTGPKPHAQAHVSRGLEAEARAVIEAADTFFLASAHPAARTLGARAHGVDVSHRGGPPGFSSFTADDTFIVPDYRGNNFYNSLGNLRLHAAAGLLFIDFAHGHLLEVSATADSRLGAHPLAGPESTGRIVRFQAQQARFYPHALELRVAG
jgi:uncharacterized protein